MSIAKARHFRKHLTEHEVKMWSALRELRSQGLHFRRQAPLDGYFLDFVCHRAKLIVEVDGVQHAVGERLRLDRVRDEHFARSGYQTLRYWNSELDTDLDGLVDGIFRIAMARLAQIGCPTRPELRSGHPPREGEG